MSQGWDQVAADVDRDPDVGAFWEVARFHTRLNAVPSYFGPTTAEVLPPPTWSFGETPEEADEGLRALLDTGEATLRASLGEVADAIPSRGALGIVLDGAGHPRALVGTTEVTITGSELIEQLMLLHSQ